MTAIIAFFTTAAGKYAALIAIAATVLGTAWRAAFKAGKNSQLAKEGQANAKALDDLARANAARAASNSGKLSDNDKYKRD